MKNLLKWVLSPAQWSKGVDILARTGKVSPEQKRQLENDPFNLRDVDEGYSRIIWFKCSKTNWPNTS